jgi:hypothetical protein
MTFATLPPRGEFGRAAHRGRDIGSAATVEGPTDRAVHGIFFGCVVCAPFWLAVLAFMLSR